MIYSYSFDETLEQEWKSSPRWKGIKRDYTVEQVNALKPSIDIEDTLEPDGRWVVEVRDADGPLYSISIASRKLR